MSNTLFDKYGSLYQSIHKQQTVSHAKWQAETENKATCSNDSLSWQGTDIGAGRY